jgi:nucleoside-diphosphate-sugar epimerase
MRVFITGASGWIGSVAVDELLAAGHEVVGLARSDASAAALEAKGATVHRGDLDDLDSLRTGALSADAVIHLANKHDFAHPEVSNAAERASVQALGDALAGSGRTLLVASGVGAPGTAGRALNEDDPSPNQGADSPRGGSENLALDYVAQGVHASVVRFAPSVHGAGDHGLIAILIGIARAKGVSGYVGDGTGRWPAAHRSDAGRVVSLGVEKAAPGSRLHAIGEEGIPTREIAEAIGQGLGLPVTSIAREGAMAHFGWIGGFFGMDIPTSSLRTQELLGWTPTGPTLLDDLRSGIYF